ncbi:MAG TPA: glycoside hydrolase family 2 TIM barrel-domain containing protein [Bacteroidales bacterium]|nr:glycoside hydrolase family 2 TIM barrel-domain containing protein [Bacteroidales bacterium]
MNKAFFTAVALAYCLAVSAQQKNYLDHVYDYIENTSVFEQGQEEGHVPLIPFATLQEALGQNMKASASCLFLNGTWKFFYSDTPEGTPRNFYEDKFNDKSWADIIVPGNWEMQGFGDPMFRNVTTPFKPNPPKVPHEYNPTGSYRRSFSQPATWKGKQVFLRFEKVASASFVWINGRQVGYNEGGQEPAEYNITSFLKPGKNTIAVNVMKYSDGYYLENQDYWRLAGIFDKVWLFAVPEIHINDWFATTDLDEKYEDAILRIEMKVKDYGSSVSPKYTARATLYNSQQQPVKVITSAPFTVEGGSAHSVMLSDSIMNPLKWSAESPDLYTLVMELIDASGKTTEIVSGRIGFKETEIRDQVFYLNGKPVKLNAINSHMQHPDKGHTMDLETIRKDFELLKQFNINCVRTSHYPPVNAYLDLADEYGIYIVDETGDESHATEYVSNLPEWENMYRERVRKMVLRDRNHPCILFWSAGNESGEGKNICAVIEEGKKYDPTRFWMYGGNAFAHPCEEIIGPRYYTPFEMRLMVGMVPTSEDPRPSFMDEYLSLAGNGGGGLDEYWDMIYEYPRSMGGALWDFVSPGLREKVRALDDASPSKVPAHIMGRAFLTKGKAGSGIDLNGHDQWVEVYRDNAVEIENDSLTLSMWVYPRKFNSSAGTLLTKGSYQYGLVQKGTRSLEFYITTQRRESLDVALPADWENNWHHIAAVYNGITMQLFIDGKKSGEKPATGNIRNFPYPVNVGRNAQIHGQETSEYLCDGIFDEVAIFSKVMDPQLLLNPDPAVKQKASLWLDFEKEKAEGEFFSLGIGARSYGAIWPDRRPQPEMWQIKKAGQPVSVRLLDGGSGKIQVINRYLFTRLSELETRWSIESDGQSIAQGVLTIDAAPLDTILISVPYTKPEITPGKEYFLTISFHQKMDKPWAKAGFEIAFEQFTLPWKVNPETSAKINTPGITVTEINDTLIIKCVQFDYRFDRKTGKLAVLHFNGKTVIKSGPSINVWRAPLANETDEWGSSSSGTTHWGEGYSRMAATDWYSTGINRLNHHLESFRYESVDMSLKIEVHELVTFLNSSSGFQNNYTYIINGDGSLTICHKIIPWGDMPAWLPRIGTSWILNRDLDHVEWFGRGPQENYPDRKSGYRVGKYSSSVTEMYEPYLIPQDYGLRTDNRSVAFYDNKGMGIEFSGDEPFNFNAWPYTVDNLSKALYTYQLKPFDGITFNFDHLTSGVGCTARSVFNAYRVLPAVYEYKIIVRPFAGNQAH